MPDAALMVQCGIDQDAVAMQGTQEDGWHLPVTCWIPKELKVE
jgi:methenyltetrahydromethanopterin cyclohydrolase